MTLSSSALSPLEGPDFWLHTFGAQPVIPGRSGDIALPVDIALAMWIVHCLVDSL